jgi:Flp pilus assembly protein TadG
MDHSRSRLPSDTVPAAGAGTQGWTRGFSHDERGATAVEFGMIALPFFALLFAIIETALIFWSTQVLETAVSDASRRLYTGQFQTVNAAVTDEVTLINNFRKEICTVGGQKRPTMFTCDNVKIEVRALDAFPGSQPPSPITSSGQLDSNFNHYEKPKPEQIVVVRAVVEYPVLVSLFNPKLANLANGNRLLMATTTFRAEPYTQ